MDVKETPIKPCYECAHFDWETTYRKNREYVHQKKQWPESVVCGCPDKGVDCLEASLVVSKMYRCEYFTEEHPCDHLGRVLKAANLIDSNEVAFEEFGGFAKIAKKDCIEAMRLMPDKSIDLVVTDPPYGIAYTTGHRREKGHRFTEEILNDKDLSIVEAATPELYRVLKNDSACFMFCDREMQEQVREILVGAGFAVKNRIIWDKGNHTAGDTKGAFGYRYEVLLYAVKGKPEIRGRRHSDLWFFARVGSDKLKHQNEKPTGLLERAIRSLSDSGAIVLDPFMGSGSTGSACLNAGRQFIGFELDDYYYEVARERLQKESEQGRLPL